MTTAASRTLAQRRGDAAEGLVAARLEAAGWTILGRQMRVGRHELDIIAVDPGPPGALVIVEVRARTDPRFGLPEETVDRRKVARLHAAIGRLLAAGRLPDGRPLPRLPIRLDVVAVDLARGGWDVRHHRAVG
jgi:putative endonuclease